MTSTQPDAPRRPISPAEMVQAVKHLPSAPRVLPRIKNLLSDCNSSMDEIVTLIRLDPAIAAQVVRVANSVLYGSNANCSAVEEAVGRVGFDQVYELITYSVASQVLIRPLKVYGIEPDDFWKQNITCALAAEALGKQTGQDPAMAYTLGLLHSVGMVVIDEWALRHQPSLHLGGEAGIAAAAAREQLQLGFTHAEAGAALLQHWGFSAAMCRAVRWQDFPDVAGTSSPMAAILQVAKWVRSAACDPGNPPVTLPDSLTLDLLSLQANALPAIIAEVVLRLEEISPMLEIETLVADVPAQARFPVDSWKR